MILVFSPQPATGLPDIVPSGTAAHWVIAIIQICFGGVMYLAVIVTRLKALQYNDTVQKIDL